MKPTLLTTLRRAAWAVAAVFALVTGLFDARAWGDQTIKVGIIGLDAHAVPWTQIIHNPAAKPPISNMRIVAAVAVPSPDIPFSADNIQQNTEAMRKLGVEVVGSIEEMLSRVDAVMLLSIDGRPHPAQAKPVFAARKPLYIDKPVASSLAEIIEIYRAADESGTPVFSNSSLRYGPATAALAHDAKLGRVLGCDTYCNSQSILPGHPDLFYYGIHGCDPLFAIMGTGCETVSRIKTPTADLVTGQWKDGRVGTYRGILQGQVGFGATVFGEKGIVSAGKFEGYEPLLAEIAKFFQTGKAPVSVEETLEIYAFLTAADVSLHRDGRPVTIESVLAESRKQAAARRAAAGVGRPVRIVSLSFREKTRAQVEALVDQHAAAGVDLVLLPETFLGQKDSPETVEGPTVTAFSALARKHHTYVVCPIDRRDGQRRLNSAVLLDRQGKIQGVYDKVFPYWSEYDLKESVSVGAGAPVFETDFGKLGLAICFDVNFPEVWQRLADQGAEIVVWPSAYSAGTSLQAHALNHHFYVVTSTWTRDCLAYDITGEEIYYSKSQDDNVARLTLDLDRGIYHQNFNIEGRDKLLREHGSEVRQAKWLDREQWFVLEATRPGVSARQMARQYGLEELRDYLNRSRREIDRKRGWPFASARP
jgi:predicted amidohydrolase/predicted dehydrogenase